MTEAEVGTDGRGAVLLKLARRALREAVGGDAPAPPPREPWLARSAATFVTLKRRGQLRGCIGSLEPRRPLAEDVRENAVAAGLRDPRFPALRAEELEEVQIEVSLLSELEPLDCRDEADLLARLRPGVDGLVLEHSSRRGTFLPAVWRHYPEPAEFVRQLKRKAGLAPDFWSPAMAISRYTVRHWCEPPPAGVAAGE